MGLSSLAIWGLIVIKFWLVAAQPLNAIGPAGHDDRLFLDLADHILEGRWLGNYSQFTLMKGPMFSLWIAAVFKLGVPLPLANQGLYLAACGAMVGALRPLRRGRLGGVVLFAVLWFNPMSFEMSVLGRVLRQNIYTPISLLLWAGLVALLTYPKLDRWRLLGLGGAIGGLAGCFYLTREESVWIVPAALVIGAGYGWRWWREGPGRRRRVVWLLAGGGASFAAVVGAVCGLNLRHYGWFGTVEFRAPEFRAAYGALQRIEGVAPVPHVPVTKAARDAAYGVSPAFAELRPWLEGEVGLGWATGSSPWTGHPPEDLEISAGAFMWALRDAMMNVEAGHNARQVLEHYGRIAAEVNAAVDAGRLTGAERRDSFAPKIDGAAVGRLLDGAGAFFRYFVTFQGFSAETPPSVGDGPMLALFRDLTRWRHSDAPEAPEFRLPRQQRADRGRVGVLSKIGAVYAAVSPVVTGVALAALAWLTWGAWRSRSRGMVWLVPVSLLAAVVVSVGVNLAVHELAFYNLSPGALAQAYPFLLTFQVVAIGLALGTLRRDREITPTVQNEGA